MSLLTHPAAELWLTQFSANEAIVARGLLKNFMFVTSHEFTSEITAACAKAYPGEKVAFYIERALGHRHVRIPGGFVPKVVKLNGKTKIVKVAFQASTRLMPVAMYKQHKLAGGAGGGRAKRISAHGAALPAVASPRNDKQDIGSEAVVAAAVTSACRADPRRLFLQPSAELLRKERIHRLVIATDFIGSGDRVADMLLSLWRVRSVRSWFNGQGMTMSVLAFSATKQALDKLERHKLHPAVSVVRACPTIKTKFKGKAAAATVALCTKHAPDDERPLGHGDVGALIAFEHSCPNNVPSIFIDQGKTRAKPWQPLFPKRTTSHIAQFQNALSAQEKEKLALETMRYPQVASSRSFLSSTHEQRRVLIVLAALSRGHRSLDELATTTSLSLAELSTSIAGAISGGYVDANRRPTEQGTGLLRALTTASPQTSLPNTTASFYYPMSLRSFTR